MININTIPTKILIQGKVNVKVYDALDLERMEPKVSIVGQNVVEQDLLEKMTDAMHSSSGSSLYFLNTSSYWFDGRYAGDNATEGTTDRDGQNGILVVSSEPTGWVAPVMGGAPVPINHFYLYQNKSTTNTTNETEWEAESEWGIASSTTISEFHMGKDYYAGTGIPTATFNDPFATYDVPNFTMQQSDILRVTWTISVG
jgi:hypothetical protein